MVNQKKRAIALMMLVTARTWLGRVFDVGRQGGGGVRGFAKSYQRLGEVLVSMHRHVACYVMENVRLRQVIQMIPAPDRDGGRELAIAQAVEEQEGGHVTADGFSLKTSERLQEAIDVLQTRHPVMVQFQVVQPGAKVPVRVALTARQQTPIQSAPCPVVLFRVKLVGLMDVNLPIVTRLFNERRLGGGETRHRTLIIPPGKTVYPKSRRSWAPSGDFIGAIGGIPGFCSRLTLLACNSGVSCVFWHLFYSLTS